MQREVGWPWRAGLLWGLVTVYPQRVFIPCTPLPWSQTPMLQKKGGSLVSGPPCISKSGPSDTDPAGEEGKVPAFLVPAAASDPGARGPRGPGIRQNCVPRQGSASPPPPVAVTQSQPRGQPLPCWKARAVVGILGSLFHAESALTGLLPTFTRGGRSVFGRFLADALFCVFVDRDRLWEIRGCTEGPQSRDPSETREVFIGGGGSFLRPVIL